MVSEQSLAIYLIFLLSMKLLCSLICLSECYISTLCIFFFFTWTVDYSMCHIFCSTGDEAVFLFIASCDWMKQAFNVPGEFVIDTIFQTVCHL